MMATERTCPGCKGSGRVRKYLHTLKPDGNGYDRTESVEVCDVCAGRKTLTLEQGELNLPEVRISGTVHVINPGDPGYEEAKARLERRQQETT